MGRRRCRTRAVCQACCAESLSTFFLWAEPFLLLLFKRGCFHDLLVVISYKLVQYKLKTRFITVSAGLYALTGDQPISNCIKYVECA